jgi:hypothetical protein
MKILIHCVTAILFHSAFGLAETRQAKIFAIDKSEGSPLFLQTTEHSKAPDGLEKTVTTIKDAEGNVAIYEEAEFRGDNLVSQYVRQLQTKESYRADVKDGVVTFLRFKIEGSSETSTGKPKSEPQSKNQDEPFITGPVFENFLNRHWSELLDGKTIDVRLGVLEVAESVGFKFWIPKPPKGTSGDPVQVLMKPSNLFISLALDTIEIDVDPSSHHIIRYVGRTPLVAMKNGKNKPLDGNVVYDVKK